MGFIFPSFGKQNKQNRLGVALIHRYFPVSAPHSVAVVNGGKDKPQGPDDRSISYTPELLRLLLCAVLVSCAGASVDRSCCTVAGKLFSTTLDFNERVIKARKRLCASEKSASWSRCTRTSWRLKDSLFGGFADQTTELSPCRLCAVA